MQAVVCHGPRDYRLETIPVPTRGPGEILVRVEAVGICASDLKCYHGAAKFWGDANRPADHTTNSRDHCSPLRRLDLMPRHLGQQPRRLPLLRVRWPG